MNIISNNINRLINNPLAGNQCQVKSQNNVTFGNNTNLPAVHIIGQSQINSNLPVNYNKIGEIDIPGLKDKAQIYKLSNGQRVIIASKKGPAFIHTTYSVGSMNEPDNIRGMSHYIEHNLFNGSKNLKPKEYDEKVSELGGETNATTSFAATDYYLQLQLLNDNSLENAIKLNALQTQFPTFPQDQLEKEKSPVKSEIDMCSDNPDTIAVCKALKNLFKIQTKCEDFVIGTKDNINSFNKEKVLDYFNTWYTPDNAVTVITGDVNSDETINLVAKHFNKKNDYSHINKRYYEPIQYNDKPIREDIIKSNTTQPSVTMAFAIPDGTTAGDLTKLDTLFGILSSTNSNFYKTMDKLGVSIDITMENMQNKPKGAKAAIITAFAPEDKLEDTINAIYSEITNISNKAPTQEEVNNIKKSTINKLLNATENSRNLNTILTNAALSDNYNYINSTINTVNNITPVDISLTARKFLDLNKISMCVSHDKNSTVESITNNYKKSSKQISFGSKISPTDNLKEETSKIQQSRLINNIETTVIPGNTYAKSAVCIDFKTDELNKTNSPDFMVLNEIFSRGSIVKGADNFNKILNSKDISMTFATGTDGLSVISEFNGEDLNEVMAMLKEKLMYPNFTQEEFLRAKQLVKETIQAENVSAFSKLNQELNPEIKKYEDKETRLNELEKLTLRDIKTLHSKILNTSMVQAVLTKNTGVNSLNAFNNGLSTGLPVFKPFKYEKNQNYNIYKPNETEKTLTEEREQSQAEIVQGYKFKKPENINDIAKIELLNMILGSGGMSSRLFLDLRENKKLAYSVGSRIVTEKDTGILYLRIGTTTDSYNSNEDSSENITKALNGFSENVNKLKTENVSFKELENAKTIYKTRILDALETNISKAFCYLNSQSTYYGVEYNQKLFEAIDKVTVEDIKSTANYVFKNPPVTSIAASKNTLKDFLS